ncbi:type IV CRISPR-associated protein Csf3 [Thioalkalivibrio sp. ALE16]|uniref:type IV CRISPR-associated protein Csf3 n=1 Tax=Thioalkalivibrio sp. ALE16 TaxID=1158172 RepID=UPI00039B7661|nr:type IV CRISPR-associated protein Csf3 [Thioalkalivibrio sp. ALE16]
MGEGRVMAAKTMEPLRITGRMHGLMVEPERPIALDGILAWAMVERARMEGAEDPLAAQESLPLAFDKDRGVWKASWVFRRYESPLQTRQQTKKTDVPALLDGRNAEHWEGRVDSIATGTGMYKGAVLDCTYRQISEVSAWCIGDRERIEELLGMVHGLGSRRRQGFGRISGWTVEPDPEAENQWGQRALPDNPGGFLRSTGALSPPYWRQDRVQLIWTPITDQL